VSASTRCLSILLSACLLAGCGDSAPKSDQVSGKVTFDGQPVVYGAINFIPDADKGHKGPAGNAEIIDGVYNTADAGGSGLLKGPHIARVTVFPEKLPPTNLDDSVLTKAPQPITIGFPVNVEVNGPTLDIEVPAKAKGFDMNKTGRSSGPRPGEP